MDTIVLVVRMALAGVFALAGAAKLLDLSGSREAVEGFGVPRGLVPIVGTGLPLAELAVAAAVLPTPSARWAAIAAVLLLVAFSAGVARVLRQGVELDCNCFGQVASEPVSAKTLLRNVVLGGLAVFAAIVGPGASLSSWTTNTGAANLLAALATATVIVLAAVLLARRGAAIAAAGAPTRIDDADMLQQGTRGPDFTLPTLEGTKVSLEQLLAKERPVVLVFASPVCSPCVGLLPHLARWNTVISNDVTLVVVESGWQDHQLSDTERQSLGGLITVTEPRRDLASAYKAPGTPCAISLTPGGLVSSPPMPGANQVERLIRQVLETGRGLEDGVAAPTMAVST